MPGNDPNVHQEHLRGRYAIITALITLIGVILSALITAKYGPVTVNVNLDEYIRNHNTSSSQNAEQETDEISFLEAENAVLNLENTNLREEVDRLEMKYTELLQQYVDLINELNPKDIKLTSLPVLGNNHEDLNRVYDSPQNTGDAISNLGDSFDSCISMQSNGNIDFYLNREYQWLNAIICISEETKNISGYSSRIAIYKVEWNEDSEVLTTCYSSPSITMGFVPDEIEPIDVSDVEHLRITCYTSSFFGVVPRIILGNPVLTPK